MPILSKEIPTDPERNIPVGPESPPVYGSEILSYLGVLGMSGECSRGLFDFSLVYTPAIQAQTEGPRITPYHPGKPLPCGCFVAIPKTHKNVAIPKTGIMKLPGLGGGSNNANVFFFLRDFSLIVQLFGLVSYFMTLFWSFPSNCVSCPSICVFIL